IHKLVLSKPLPYPPVGLLPAAALLTLAATCLPACALHCQLCCWRGEPMCRCDEPLHWHRSASAAHQVVCQVLAQALEPDRLAQQWQGGSLAGADSHTDCLHLHGCRDTPHATHPATPGQT
ncbi:hypothetical protein V8C86DRAFT_2736820, partial [Haematococcus lacustris]